MPRTKRSRLPRVTPQDLEQCPHDIRSTPNGGWAWVCFYCNRYACDRSVKGRYLCRCHGGSTPRQRCGFERVRRREALQPPRLPPGRPVEHGLYARVPAVKVSDLFAEAVENDRALLQKTQCAVEQARVKNAWMMRAVERRL